jgi:hypothetical protein
VGIACFLNFGVGPFNTGIANSSVEGFFNSGTLGFDSGLANMGAAFLSSGAYNTTATKSGFFGL